MILPGRRLASRRTRRTTRSTARSASASSSRQDDRCGARFGRRRRRCIDDRRRRPHAANGGDFMTRLRSFRCRCASSRTRLAASPESDRTFFYATPPIAAAMTPLRLTPTGRRTQLDRNARSRRLDLQLSCWSDSSKPGARRARSDRHAQRDPRHEPASKCDRPPPAPTARRFFDPAAVPGGGTSRRRPARSAGAMLLLCRSPEAPGDDPLGPEGRGGRRRRFVEEALRIEAPVQPACRARGLGHRRHGAGRPVPAGRATSSCSRFERGKPRRAISSPEAPDEVDLERRRPAGDAPVRLSAIGAAPAAFASLVPVARQELRSRGSFDPRCIELDGERALALVPGSPGTEPCATPSFRRCVNLAPPSTSRCERNGASARTGGSATS